MNEFQCGSPVCNSRFTASDDEELMKKVAEHVRTKHRIPAPTKSILAFLEANTIHEHVPPPKNAWETW